MAWQLLAILVIVSVTVIWFVRDERRLRNEADLQRAARYYAHAPKYRYAALSTTDEPVAAPRLRTGGLSSEQRAFIESFTAARAPEQS